MYEKDNIVARCFIKLKHGFFSTGYMPELNTNGNIQFKKEGDKYFISIDKRDTSPMYLTVGLSYIYNDTYSVDKVSKALKELNAYKAVKVVCF